MDEVLHRHEGELLAGTVVDRPNRFVVRVAFDGPPERAFLGDPGALAVLEPGREILCSPVADSDRATDYDAIAVAAGDAWVSLRAALANDLFHRTLERGRCPALEPYDAITREPPLPDHGRTDFRLARPDGPDRYVEVKSCTHAEDGVVKFPDRPTERGRRHLRSLMALREAGHPCDVVFVVQRPDARVFTPFREVDPAFAQLLGEARDRGVGVHVVVVEFDPPAYVLRASDLPVRL